MTFDQARVEFLKALQKTQKEVVAIGKGGENTYDRYKYARLEDYYKAVRDVALSNDLVVFESVTEHDFVDGRKTKKDENQYAARVKLSLYINHVQSGTGQEVVVYGEGQDRADKATYKAITGARKYAYALAFNLVTTDDPEADHKVGLDDDSDKHGRPKASYWHAKAELPKQEPEIGRSVVEI